MRIARNRRNDIVRAAPGTIVVFQGFAKRTGSCMPI